MAAAVPQKIVLKSTTKITLNERFSNLPKVKTVQPSQQQVRPSLAQQQSSAKNRRLALQMANRPSVAAALKLKKKSLKQRLGSNVKSRLSINNQKNQINRRGGLTPKRGVRKTNANQSPRGAKFANRGQRGGFNSVKSFNNRGRSFRNRRGSQKVMTPNRNQGKAQTFANRGRGRGRGQRGQFQRGRGQSQRGLGQRRNYMPASREDLDKELDAYMSQTRCALDAELDAYMADS